MLVQAKSQGVDLKIWFTDENDKDRLISALIIANRHLQSKATINMIEDILKELGKE